MNEQRMVTIRDAEGREHQEPDPWVNVPESEIQRELRAFFAKYPDQKQVWLVPAKYSDGGWTASYCVEFPSSNAHRRLYGVSFARIF